MALVRGEPFSRTIGDRIGAVVADTTALAALPLYDLAVGKLYLVTAGPELYEYSLSVLGANEGITVTAGGSMLRVTESKGGLMLARLRLLGAPGAAVEGDTVTIGTTVYEFRASTPPAGGTAGRVWVFNGADSAASRANLIKAINATVDAAVVTRNGVASPAVLAVAGVTLGDVIIMSAITAGGTPRASATAHVTTTTLATATDIWDAATMEGGYLDGKKRSSCQTITLAASHIAKGTVQFYFPFNVTHAIVFNRTTPTNGEAVAVSGARVSVTLAGGAVPNHQAADVLTCYAQE